MSINKLANFIITNFFFVLIGVALDSESNERTIHVLSRSDILPIVFECMRTDVCPLELNIEAAQLLLLLTEDNAPLCAVRVTLFSSSLF
jgi:hypothetical protein